MAYTIRQVMSRNELIEVFDLLGAQLDPPFGHQDRRFEDLERRFPEDAPLMIVVDDRGRIRGGALAFRRELSVTLRVIALEPRLRRQGLGRRLVERIEFEATRLGAHAVGLAARGDAVGFYRHLGYRGSSGMVKQLPLSVASRSPDERRQKLDELRTRRARRGHDQQAGLANPA